MPTPAESRGRAAAIEEIRTVEAARVIGMLETDPLPTLARQWIRDGVDDVAAYELARLDSSTPGADPQLRTELMATLAADCGIRFATVQQARSVHAMTVLVKMGSAPDPSRVVFDFSNNFTDHLTGTLLGSLRNALRRRRPS